jgi:hypothetical protein
MAQATEVAVLRGHLMEIQKGDRNLNYVFILRCPSDNKKRKKGLREALMSFTPRVLSLMLV